MTIVARYVDARSCWARRMLHEASLQEALPLELGAHVPAIAPLSSNIIAADGVHTRGGLRYHAAGSV